MTLYIGQAGWSIPKAFSARFGPTGTHLERYAGRLTGVEINSSFYRPHQPKTYAKWAASVPEDFRFTVKVPRQITHFQRLKNSEFLLDAFLLETSALGPKRGALLVQLPPSLKFDLEIVRTFFEQLRERYNGPVALEPRHLTWFQPDVDAMLVAFEISRAAVDPALVPAAASPGGYAGFSYYRWHGSPRMYYSDYPPTVLAALAEKLRASAELGPTWCIFDNTTIGAATGNALDLLADLQAARG